MYVLRFIIGAGLLALTAVGCGASTADPGEATGEVTPIFETDLDVVEGTSNLERGVTYRYPLYIHCGMGYLGNFNGTHWHLTDAPHGTANSGSSRAVPDGWPIAQETIQGMVTLVDATTIEYSIPEVGVIGVYEASTTPPSECM